MPIDLIAALIGFAFVMSISPGPANLLLLTSGANFGLVRTVPLLLGVSLGFLSMVFAVGLGLGEVFARFPSVALVLRFVCGAYILWLAFKIASAKSMGSGEMEEMGKPMAFIEAAMLQLLNPKAWTVAILVTVNFLTQADYFTNLLVLVGVFALVNMPSIAVWAVSGAALKRFLSSQGRIIWFNRLMAILLVASMMPLLLQA